ncbi:MAG: hypothetical protein FIA89_08965 [Geobacter sp.]|nr:hypothetical protein [Geobacter sp.]
MTLLAFQRSCIAYGTSPVSCLFFGLFFFSLSVAVTYSTSNPVYVAKSGAMIILLGLFLTTRNLLRLGVEGAIQSQSVTDGGTFIPTPSSIEEKIELEKDIKAQRWGFWYFFIGTFVWGYGDDFYSLVIKVL